MLVEGPVVVINGRFGSPGERISINFSKENTKFCVNLYFNTDNSYLFVNGQEMLKFKAVNKNVSFLTQFCLCKHI